jgi:hypothetical protein
VTSPWSHDGVAESLSAAALRASIEHRRGHVDPGRVAHLRRKGASDEPAAAGDVEHPRSSAPGIRPTRRSTASASSAGERRAALNTVAWRVNWSRIKSWWAVSVISNGCSNRARPWAHTTTVPSARHSTKSSLSASSQAQLSGQVLLHAARASATRRGFASTHSEKLHHQEFGFAGHRSRSF